MMTSSIPTLTQSLTDLAQSDFEHYQAGVVQAILSAKSESDLQELKVALQGKKSDLTALSKQMGGLSDDDKKRYGGYLTAVRTALQSAFETQGETLAKKALDEKLAAESIDITLPARGKKVANLHPVTLVAQRMQGFFNQAGFVPAQGPEVESDYYNFEALNIPETHPARAMHDTFYFDAQHLLRTHTSGVQIRTMENSKPPIRITTVGRVYRCDSDQTHSPMFHQMEGLFVDKNITFAETKSLIVAFLEQFFGKKLTVRFRPSFFPFTEPSAEVDILADNGKWLEVMGCGMVHPKVLANCNIDPNEYQGFAFGMGIERFAMLYYGVNDLRLFYQNDVRFLKQFA